MLRSLLRTAISVTDNSTSTSTQLFLCRSFSVKNKQPTVAKGKKGKSKLDSKGKPNEIFAADASVSDLLDEDPRERRLAEDENNKALDVGPNGRPLFISATSLSQLTKSDTCTYMKFSMEELNSTLPEGLPLGMVNEFEESKRNALLVRQSFLDLRDNFRRIVDPPLYANPKGPKAQKQIVLDGPVSCGKSIALAMLVQWARAEGWLVFYVPKGREWTHGGFFYKNLLTGFWDTPFQAANTLKDFLKYNESHLRQLPCQIFDPIPLGEGAGVGWMKNIQSMELPQGSTLYDLVDIGLTHTHAAVGVIVRLRKELSLVKDIPVLIAVDQYNNWFTFSEYEEPVLVKKQREESVYAQKGRKVDPFYSCRPIHARELATVNAFRPMMHNDMMVGAFSHSTAVGKLRKDLPDVPADARINFPRYSLDEAATVCHYYLRQRLVRREVFSEESWKKIYFLSNGNGAEMRWLAPFMR